MTTNDIVANVLDHLKHGQQKHPATKTPQEWQQVLAQRLSQLLTEITNYPSAPDNSLIAKRAAQLAALCVRFIDENNLTLFTPPTTTH